MRRGSSIAVVSGTSRPPAIENLPLFSISSIKRLQILTVAFSHCFLPSNIDCSFMIYIAKASVQRQGHFACVDMQAIGTKEKYKSKKSREEEAERSVVLGWFKPIYRERPNFRVDKYTRNFAKHAQYLSCITTCAFCYDVLNTKEIRGGKRWLFRSTF